MIRHVQNVKESETKRYRSEAGDLWRKHLLSLELSNSGGPFLKTSGTTGHLPSPIQDQLVSMHGEFRKERFLT